MNLPGDVDAWIERVSIILADVRAPSVYDVADAEEAAAHHLTRPISEARRLVAEYFATKDRPPVKAS